MRRIGTIVAVLSCCVWVSGENPPAPPTSPAPVPDQAPPRLDCEDQSCPSDRVCVAQKCVDPCVGKPCGQNALCQVHDHHAACVCAEGFSGDPLLGCLTPVRECESNQDCVEDKVCAKNRCVAKKCVDVVCAAGALCVVKANVAKCECHLGLEGDGKTRCDVPPPEDPSRFGAPSLQVPGSRGDVLCKGNRFPKVVGKKVYHVVTNIKANWYNAYMYCKSHGHSLATVESEAENDMILEAIRETGIHNGYFFVAGTDHPMEEHWFWMTTGLPISRFTYWHTTRPSCHTSLNCMAYVELDYPTGRVGYRWYDRLCNAELFNFICEDYI